MIAPLSALQALPPTADVLAGPFVWPLMWRCVLLASVFLCHCAIIFQLDACIAPGHAC